MSINQVAPRLIHGVKHLMPDIIISSAKGSYLNTECGRHMLDFSCGIGVTNLGHSHDRVTKAVTNAAPNLVHAQQNIFKHRPMVDLINRLANLNISKMSRLDSWFFWNSGSEAVEAAVKLARHATGKPNIVAFNFGYHGRTIGTMALTSSSTIYRSGFGPLMGGTSFSPFPYLTQSPYSMDNVHKLWGKSHHSIDGYAYWGAAPTDVTEKETQRCLQAVEMLLRTQSSPAETAAFILEPVLGEGGYVPSPPGFLKGLKEICQKHGILLIADEVQTGFGRTGAMFACDWIDNGVDPDILVCAKGLANGYPLSAIGTRQDLSKSQPPGSMGGTYGGNAVACAAALAVLDSFEIEGVLSNTMNMEKELRKGLVGVENKFPGVIREVRGRGLMIGVEFERGGGVVPSNLVPVGSTASSIAINCHKRDLVILSCGPYDTLRFIPPLNITKADIELGIAKFSDAVEEYVTKTATQVTSSSKK